jgi:hypothetical protein
MSPIIFIHGNNSDGGFFDRQHFTDALKAQHLVYDNSITMKTNTRAAHAALTNTRNCARRTGSSRPLTSRASPRRASS